MTKKNQQQKSDKIILAVKPRKVFGKKLKQLRKQGILPGNIFGQDYKSKAVTVDLKDFQKVYRKVKETGVFYLKEEDKTIPVLIKNVQSDPIKDFFLHVDFRKIDLAKKITTEVPIKINGTSEAVSQKNGVLLTLVKELKVEAEPEKIPPQIEIDISNLKEINQEIKVGDLSVEGYKILDPPTKTIVSVVAHKEESVVPETTVATPEVITEKKPETESAETEKKPTAAVKPTPPPSSPTKKD